MINGYFHQTQCAAQRRTSLNRDRFAAVWSRSAAMSSWFAALACLVFVTGCPTTGEPGDGDGDGDAGAPTATSVGIISFRNNFEISLLEEPVSVLYDAVIEPATDTAGISGFYVPVADGSGDAAPIGDQVVVAESLPSGTNRAFDFDPGVVGVGFYRVGVIVNIDGTETVATSEGIVQVQGPPVPRFILPTEDLTEVTPGAEVLVSFDASYSGACSTWRKTTA